MYSLKYKDRRIILPKAPIEREKSDACISSSEREEARPKVKEGGTTLDPIRVLRADIDYNKHLNNAKYIRMAMELLPEDFEVTPFCYGQNQNSCSADGRGKSRPTASHRWLPMIRKCSRR